MRSETDSGCVCWWKGGGGGDFLSKLRLKWNIHSQAVNTGFWPVTRAPLILSCSDCEWGCGHCGMGAMDTSLYIRIRGIANSIIMRLECSHCFWDRSKPPLTTAAAQYISDIDRKSRAIYVYSWTALKVNNYVLFWTQSVLHNIFLWQYSHAYVSFDLHICNNYALHCVPPP